MVRTNLDAAPPISLILSHLPLSLSISLSACLALSLVLSLCIFDVRTDMPNTLPWLSQSLRISLSLSLCLSVSPPACFSVFLSVFCPTLDLPSDSSQTASNQQSQSVPAMQIGAI